MLLSILREAATESTAHGLPRIISSPKWIAKAFWSSIVLAASATLIYMVVLRIDKYLQYPKFVNLELGGDRVSKQESRFPDVSFCNLYPYELGKVRELTELTSRHEALLEKLVSTRNVSKCETINSDIDSQYSSNISLSTRVTFLRYMCKVSVIQDEVKNRSSLPRTMAVALAAKVSDMSSQAYNLGKEALRELSLPFNKFVAHCLFKYEECGEEAFIQYMNPDYGMCYTFKDTSKSSMAVNDRNALWITFHVESPDLDEEFTHNHTRFLAHLYPSSPFVSPFGVIMSIHHPGSSAYFHSQGFYLSPGFSTSLAVKKQRRIRVSTPIAWCNEEEDKDTHYECMAKCQLRMQHRGRRCQCTDSVKDNSDNFLPELNISRCISFAVDSASEWIERVQCGMHSRKEFSTSWESQEHCQCLRRCSEVDYSTHSSAATWPAPHLLPTMITGNLLNRDVMQRRNYSYWQHGGVYRNFLRANIYPKELGISMVFNESLAYDTFDLFSDIGGNMGLWMGISLVTVAELIALLARVLYERYNKADPHAKSDAGKDEA